MNPEKLHHENDQFGIYPEVNQTTFGSQMKTFSNLTFTNCTVSPLVQVHQNEQLSPLKFLLVLLFL